MEANEINRIRSVSTVRVQYSLMEKNTLVEFFANLVSNFVDTYEFNSFKGVSSNGRRIINLDKHSTLVRIKKVTSTNSYN